MASPENQHCANGIGTLSFPISRSDSEKDSAGTHVHTHRQTDRSKTQRHRRPSYTAAGDIGGIFI